MRPPTQFSIDQVVVGHSPRMRAIFDFAKVVSRSDSSVIITGESGTGKEVVANLLHHQSARRHQPFVAVSCALAVGIDVAERKSSGVLSDRRCKRTTATSRKQGTPPDQTVDWRPHPRDWPEGQGGGS